MGRTKGKSFTLYSLSASLAVLENVERNLIYSNNIFWEFHWIYYTRTIPGKSLALRSIWCSGIVDVLLSVHEVAGSIPASVVVELLWLKSSSWSNLVLTVTQPNLLMTRDFVIWWMSDFFFFILSNIYTLGFWWSKVVHWS